jgi:hypothetical protein
MRNERVIFAVLIIAKLILSFILCFYFWNVTTITQLKQIPISIVLIAIIYIALQMLTRKLSTRHNWWDWVYYGGLVSIMITVSFATLEYFKVFQYIVELGTICLILPIFIDGYFFIKNPLNKQGK